MKSFIKPMAGFLLSCFASLAFNFNSYASITPSSLHIPAIEMISTFRPEVRSLTYAGTYRGSTQACTLELLANSDSQLHARIPQDNSRDEFILENLPEYIMDTMDLNSNLSIYGFIYTRQTSKTLEILLDRNGQPAEYHYTRISSVNPSQPTQRQCYNLQLIHLGS